MAALDVNWAVKWLTLSAQAMAEQRVYLIELDRAIGDSDHGENMDRGFQAVLAKLAEAPPETPGAALKLTAMTLMSKVGGAAGPLYGTAFLRAATSLGDAAEIEPAAWAGALAAARDGIVARGKAEPGDKTMVDAWTPAAEAAQKAAQDGDVLAVLVAAAEAAEAGAVATDPLVARKGRASYLGERSAGHRDPGAASSAMILRAAVGAAA
ncbi:dihydroxyacetone kinase subunit L [Pseudarthrobacter phenanthrenivorans]|uniref:Dihydroxyacetone kinase subunit L n=2 Tax=Pseudarthrobacter phenanthrenivorans TaxID=361575 RepID=A0A3B0FRW9_PSEPS|nr:dihydroxyacetone kinase subunit DhaL [Pseudarthrobacter phenanthrenivorans]ADX71540.1 dihydroxyacetone kinase DhaL subunit [Pseudarthrobacter phenanthrenivorans Sphe3]RKO21197.1 dihydroxyacetone kinase subunit L [Pseudarthrobacter phenanthrenivorans]TPV48751.1 dihydroxyacetone kinase subunit L [Pseudarthrobacter phenanthrenivorans]